jgi:hypothetical protein
VPANADPSSLLIGQVGSAAYGLLLNLSPIGTANAASPFPQALTGQGAHSALLAQFTVTPQGFGIQQLPGQNPLDPQGLNGPIPAGEQQQIANALSLIVNGNPSGLNPHTYNNYPRYATGAALPPPSAQGYTTYDVPGAGPGRGTIRLIIDNGTGATYYTNTHYDSFYPVLLLPPKKIGKTMRVIELDAENWSAADDFYSALLTSIGAPENHGRNLNALVDSMIWGGINATEPPYTVRIFGSAKLPQDVYREIEMARRALAEARMAFRALRDRDAEVFIEIDS